MVKMARVHGKGRAWLLMNECMEDREFRRGDFGIEVKKNKNAKQKKGKGK